MAMKVYADMQYCAIIYIWAEITVLRWNILFLPHMLCY